MAALGTAFVLALLPAACGGGGSKERSARALKTFDYEVGWLPGSRALLVWRSRHWPTSAGTLLRVAVPSGRTRVLWRSKLAPFFSDNTPPDPTLSPNGRLIATPTGDFDAIVRSAKTGALVLRTPGHDVVNRLAWAPDSQALVGQPSDLGGELRIHWLDGHTRLLTSGARDDQPAWSPDGRWIAFIRSRGCDAGSVCSRTDVYLVSARGGRPRRVASGYEPSWSPDGSRLTVSPVDGQIDVYAITRSGQVEGRVQTIDPYFRSPLLWAHGRLEPAIRDRASIDSLLRHELPEGIAAPDMVSPNHRWLDTSVVDPCSARGIWLIAVPTGRTRHLTRPCIS